MPAVTTPINSSTAASRSKSCQLEGVVFQMLIAEWKYIQAEQQHPYSLHFPCEGSEREEVAVRTQRDSEKATAAVELHVV
jgi:hypothetical protein